MTSQTASTSPSTAVARLAALRARQAAPVTTTVPAVVQTAAERYHLSNAHGR